MQNDSTEGFKKLLDRFQVDALNNKVTIKDASVGNLKADDITEWTVEFNLPKFDEIKVKLAEKYKLTPSEEAQNKAVELGKKWGTNPNGKKITPYTKAMEAGEEHALLLMDDSDEAPSIPLTLVPWGSASIKDVVKEFSTKEELKRFLKESDIDVSKDLKEETVVEIIDKFPDFFEDTELSFTEKEEKRVENLPHLVRDIPMQLASDSVFYSKPMINNVFTMEISSDESIKRMQTLLDKLDKDEKWYASYKIIERSDKYSILKIESKFKDLEIFLWHSNNNFWLAIPNETLSVNLSYPDDEFWNYESLYHYTKDEIISKTIVKGISTYYKEII